MAKPKSTWVNAPRSTSPRMFLHSATSAMRMPISLVRRDHGVSCYAVQADAGQDECQQAEELGEPRDQTLPVEIARYLLAEAHHPEHRQIRISVGQSTADGRFQALG